VGAIVVAIPLGLVAVTKLPAFAACAAPSDFNGDTFADLAIGEPTHQDAGGAEVGGVRVVYGSSTGLAVSGTTPVANQFFDLASPGMPAPGGTTTFGDAFISGDFDGDCHADLVVGAVGYPGDSGGIVVLYGSPTGLSTAGAAAFGVADLLPGGTLPSPELGRAAAVGDFDGDGSDDLALGTKGAPGPDGHGGVIVLYGTTDGLSLARRELWTQDSPFVPGVSEEFDYFGSALAAADFTGDGNDDLVVGAPGETVGTITRVGAITLIRGSATGLTGTGGQILHQGSPNVAGANEAGDGFGVALAAGDVNGDFRPDVVVGAAGEDVGSTAKDAGAVTLLKGTGAGGLTGAGSQTWNQDSAGVPGAAETFDYFGLHLTLGNLNGDGRADLVVGQPHEDVGSAADAGAVNVLYGAGAGLTASGAQSWTQSSSGVAGSAEANDRFGWAVITARVRADAAESLIIGVPLEAHAGLAGRGMIHVLRGATSRVTASGSLAVKAADLTPANPIGNGLFGWSLG
jgi:hypothetical protein